MERQVRPIVLLTDFGLTDHYVGVMKGVILSLHPQAQIIDLSHEIEPQDIASAQILLQNAHAYFPKKSIFVSVVDPGVGTDRPILGVETEEQIFLAPDNGLLGFLGKSPSLRRIVQIQDEKYFRTPVSDTFHGRDIFAPVAAHLSLGTPLKKMGTETKSLSQLDIPGPIVSNGEITGRVTAIDRFGNLITDISKEMIPEGTQIVISIGKTKIKGLSRNYAGQKEKKPLALIGSDGMVEISINQGNAAKQLALSVGTPVRIQTEKI